MNVHKAEAIVQSIYMYLCLILAHLDFIRILNYTICNRYTINLCTSEKQNTCVTFNNIVQETCYFYVKHLLFSYLQTKQESPILSRNPSSFLCCSENSIEYIQYSIYINIWLLSPFRFQKCFTVFRILQILLNTSSCSTSFFSTSVFHNLKILNSFLSFFVQAGKSRRADMFLSALCALCALNVLDGLRNFLMLYLQLYIVIIHRYTGWWQQLLQFIWPFIKV